MDSARLFSLELARAPPVRSVSPSWRSEEEEGLRAPSRPTVACTSEVTCLCTERARTAARHGWRKGGARPLCGWGGGGLLVGRVGIGSSSTSSLGWPMGELGLACGGWGGRGEGSMAPGFPRPYGPWPWVPGPYLYYRNLIFSKNHRCYANSKIFELFMLWGKVDHRVLANKLVSSVVLMTLEYRKLRQMPKP